MDKTPETMSLAMRRKNENIKKNTVASQIVKPYLEDHGYTFVEEKVCVYGKNKEYLYLADFYLPKPYRMIIEVDGPYHKEIKQIMIDAYKNNYYTKIRKFRVLRITNNWVECYLHQLQSCIEDLNVEPRGAITKLS